MEEYEEHDWSTNLSMSNKERKEKSIESYYLHNWYEKVKDLTFETHFYSEETLPDKLPFDKSMVRWENKSPKDNKDLWGPVSTKAEVIELFKGSLRCQMNKGKIYCIRKWTDNLGLEFRCFWNEQIVAICMEPTNEYINPPINELLKYISSIAHRIPFYRCVMDIAKTVDGFVLIEFNSWETNSGAYGLHWTDNTGIFYPTHNYEEMDHHITFRANGKNEKIVFDQSKIIKRVPIVGLPLNENITIQKPNRPSNWLVTDKFLYVANDIYLMRFTLDFKLVNWLRGPHGAFRFSDLQLCTDGSIYISDINKYYNFDLSDHKSI
jgi:hypothetical protein